VFCAVRHFRDTRFRVRSVCRTGRVAPGDALRPARSVDSAFALKRNVVAGLYDAGPAAFEVLANTPLERENVSTAGVCNRFIWACVQTLNLPPFVVEVACAISTDRSRALIFDNLFTASESIASSDRDDRAI
jgi:hypothetical protein